MRFVWEDADEGTTWAGYETIRVEDDGVLFEANVAPDVLEELLEPLGERVLEDLTETLLEEIDG